MLYEGHKDIGLLHFSLLAEKRFYAAGFLRASTLTSDLGSLGIKKKLAWLIVRGGIS